MWNKDRKDEAPAQTSGRQGNGTPPAEPTAPSRATSEQATIGRSIRIKGEVTGDEDLVIQGHVDGTVELDQHAVTVGPDGEVKAAITGRVITVEGHVEGDLSAEEKIVLRSSASVEGDINAPRVMLEDGARFRGGVEMGEVSDRDRRTGNGSKPSRARKTAESGTSASSTESSDASSEKAESTADEAATVTA